MAAECCGYKGKHQNPLGVRGSQLLQRRRDRWIAVAHAQNDLDRTLKALRQPRLQCIALAP